MRHQLPPLPYPEDALEPHMSRETLQLHYGKHHKTYVDKLNELVQGTEFENASLEDIIRRSEGKVFNNAAQTWNHTFFWNCLTPKNSGKPAGPLLQAIESSFGGFDAFKDAFSKAAADLFGSGWVWLVKDERSLAIKPLKDADTPIRSGGRPIITLDVWEHAYYVDYRNRRPEFISAFWNIVNWEFAARNFQA
jgi:superoxide dismutase, Fe-Mn family